MHRWLGVQCYELFIYCYWWCPAPQLEQHRQQVKMLGTHWFLSALGVSFFAWSTGTWLVASCPSHRWIIVPPAGTFSTSNPRVYLTDFKALRWHLNAPQNASALEWAASHLDTLWGVNNGSLGIYSTDDFFILLEMRAIFFLRSLPLSMVLSFDSDHFYRDFVLQFVIPDVKTVIERRVSRMTAMIEGLSHPGCCGSWEFDIKVLTDTQRSALMYYESMLVENNFVFRVVNWITSTFGVASLQEGFARTVSTAWAFKPWLVLAGRPMLGHITSRWGAYQNIIWFCLPHQSWSVCIKIISCYFYTKKNEMIIETRWHRDRFWSTVQELQHKLHLFPNILSYPPSQKGPIVVDLKLDLA